VEIYDRAGADQLILYMELPYLKHEQIAKSIRLFGERVIQPYRAAYAARETSGDTARVP
jgi:hypothetical protein